MAINRRRWRAVAIFAALSCASDSARAQQQPTAEQARAEAEAGRYDLAAKLYQQILRVEPDNAQALGGLADALEAKGRWREALTPLASLVTLQPENAARLFQLGRMESWSAERRGQALEHLKHAVDVDPSKAEYRAGYADVLSWNEKTRPEAIRILRASLESDSDSLPEIKRLATILSWNESTRTEAARLYERGLALAPDDAALLTAYGEMLSWNATTRPRAMELFDAALAKDPANIRALEGKAQLLFWSGHSKEALALYEKILAIDPTNAAALRGKAKILERRGRHQQAQELLERARSVDPNNSETLVDLARTNFELRRFAEARDLLTQAQGATGPDFEGVRRDLNRALGAFIEFGYGLRRNRGRMDYDGAQALISAKVSPANRLSFLYQPTFYRTPQQSFTGDVFEVALDSEPSESAKLHADFSGVTYTGASPQLDGTFEFEFRPRPSLQIQSGFERQPVEDSLLSLRGITSAGLFLGQVRSNLGHIGMSYSSSAQHYDVSLTYTDGLYTGRNLASNRRWGVDANLGKSLRGYRPYIRIAYGLSYQRFDHDEDFQPGAAPTRVTAGYFSPTRFLLNYGSILVSHRFGQKLETDASGTMGSQNVETTSSSFGNRQFASSAASHLVWHMNPQNDLRMSYEFLNVFNAFQRNLARVTWRHYF